MKMWRGGAWGALVVAALAAAACGDAPTTDQRGYTKAPLERPDVLITAEPTTDMDRLGEPNLPVIVDPADLPGTDGAASQT